MKCLFDTTYLSKTLKCSIEIKCMYIWSCISSRNWYLSVKEELTKIEVKNSKYDPAVFHYYVKDELQGVLAVPILMTFAG